MRMAVSGRLLGGLEHDRVAGEQRGTELPGGDDERVVPRNDGRHHAERLAANQRQVVRAGRRDLVVELVGELGVIRDGVRRLRYVHIDGVDDRLADIERLEHRKALEIAADELREAQQHPLALLWIRAAPRPRLERRARGRDRIVNVFSRSSAPPGR